MIFVVIAVNLGIYLAALLMDAINSSETRSICRPFQRVVDRTWTFVGALMVSTSCLVASIRCLAVMFQNVLVREKHFGMTKEQQQEPVTQVNTTVWRNDHDDPESAAEAIPNNQQDDGVHVQSQPAQQMRKISLAPHDSKLSLACKEPTPHLNTTPKGNERGRCQTIIN